MRGIARFVIAGGLCYYGAKLISMGGTFAGVACILLGIALFCS